MRYLLLIKGDEAADAGLTDAERRAIVEGHIGLIGELSAAGKLVVSGALADSRHATLVRTGPNGRRFVTDGPFAETKEVVGGFYVIECEGVDEAVSWAERVPESPGVAVEVWPVVM